jgi:hypothetical protein
MRPALRVGLAGANGVLGRRIAEALSQDDCLRVLPILRPGPAAVASVIAADLTDREACLAAVRRCDIVVSAAGPAARVQPALVQACIEGGRGLLDVSGRTVSRPGRGGPFVFACGLMPGWSEALPRLLVEAPGCDVRVTFTPGGALGRAGRLDYLEAAARDKGRRGTSLRDGQLVRARATAGHDAFLSAEAENLAATAGLRSLLVETSRRTGISAVLDIETQAPDARKARLRVAAPDAAAFSIAALRVCINRLARGLLEDAAADFGTLSIGAEEAFAALQAAGASIMAESGADEIETGTV